MKKLLSIFLLCFAPIIYASETYTLVVPFPPGGGTDMIARYITEKISSQFGDKFIVINRAGANGMIGYQYFSETFNHNPNTLFFGTGSSNVIENIINPDLKWNVLNDTRTLILLGKYNLQLLTLKENAYTNLSEVANANIGTYSAATEMFSKALRISDRNNNQLVPYKGEAPARMALISKEIDIIADTAVQTDDFKNRVKIIATGEPSGLFGVYAITVMKNFDKSKLADLNAKFNKVIKEPEVQQWLRQRSVYDSGGTPEDGDKIFSGLKINFEKIK